MNQVCTIVTQYVVVRAGIFHLGVLVDVQSSAIVRNIKTKKKLRKDKTMHPKQKMQLLFRGKNKYVYTSLSGS